MSQLIFAAILAVCFCLGFGFGQWQGYRDAVSERQADEYEALHACNAPHAWLGVGNASGRVLCAYAPAERLLD